MASDDSVPPKSEQENKPTARDPKVSVRVQPYDNTIEGRAAWFGELQRRLMVLALTQREGLDPEVAARAVIAHAVPHDEVSEDVYMQNVADACSLGMLTARAFADGGDARTHLSAVGRFVEKRFRYGQPSAEQRERFTNLVEECVRKHAGDTGVLERELATLDPAMNAFDADALAQVMRSLVVQVKTGSTIAGPLMAAKVSIAVDLFGDRGEPDGSDVTGATLEEIVHKRFLRARSRARQG